MPPTSPRSSSSATSTGRCAGCSRRSCPTASAAATPGSATSRRRSSSTPTCAPSCCASWPSTRADDAWPITPQRAIGDLRRALAPEDIVVSDVGAHKVWVARLYQAYEPNTVIISNGFAAMGIAIPGAIAAALVHPDRKVVALCGDGGFLMNSQELETATRVGANITVVIWRDDGYGLIDWKQRNEFGRPFGVEFGNPDFVAYAQSFGMAGLPAVERRRPLSDAHARPRGRRAVARRGAHRLRREPAPDRAPGGARGVAMSRSVRIALLALGLALGGTLAPAATPAPTRAAEAWDGSVDLYRKGAFTTQKSWLWCTAAGVQIIRNIVRGDADHARAEPGPLLRLDARPQPLRPARVGRRRPGRLDRRAAPLRRRSLSAGGQPLVRGGPALGGHEPAPDRAAGRADRRPGQPRLGPDRLLGDGRPARDRRLRGPLRARRRAAVRPPEQERLRHGARTRRCRSARFKRFFTSWRYAPKRMVWDGTFVSIQPVGDAGPAPTKVAAALPAPRVPWTFGAPVAGALPAGPASSLGRWAGHR